MEAMSTIAEIDLKTYGRLLAKTTPVVIKSEEDNERMLAAVEKLMRKGEDKLTLCSNCCSTWSTTSRRNTTQFRKARFVGIILFSARAKGPHAQRPRGLVGPKHGSPPPL